MKKTTDVNVSEFVRAKLSQNPDATFGHVRDAFVAAYPKAPLNTGSFSVAYYTQRKKLKHGSGRSAKAATKRSRIDLGILSRAAKFISEAGGFDAAIEAVRDVSTLQLT